VDRIRHLPAVIVQGSYDIPCPARTAWDLHRAWPEADFRMVLAGHAISEPAIAAGLVAATDRFARTGESSTGAVSDESFGASLTSPIKGDPMSENHGGDISSGFGDSTVTGPVSDEKAEQMMHPDRESSAGQGDGSAAGGGDSEGGRPPRDPGPAEGGSDATGGSAAGAADAGDSTEGTTPRDPGPAEGATYSEQDRATNEQDLQG
jgi:hypothetical protein